MKFISKRTLYKKFREGWLVLVKADGFRWFENIVDLSAVNVSDDVFFDFEKAFHIRDYSVWGVGERCLLFYCGCAVYSCNSELLGAFLNPNDWGRADFNRGFSSDGSTCHIFRDSKKVRSVAKSSLRCSDVE